MSDAATHELRALATSLERRFRTIVTPVDIGGKQLEIVHPASAEDLIDERDFERDERLPYWAELWPSSRVLAEWVLGMNGNGRNALELGCGAGLVATCASLAGFDVLATDYYEDALAFTRVNARRNGANVPRVQLLDWRALPAQRDRFDLVIASDVLYERPYGALVAQTIAAYLAPGGVAAVADPGRVGRDEFLAATKTRGLVVNGRTDVAFVDGSIRQEISVYEIRRTS